MRRRALLLATTAALPIAAGCSSIVGSDVPEYDCSRASRPEPSAPDSYEAVEPASYPDPPADPKDDAELVAFVESFEGAYRRNRLVSMHREDVTAFGFHAQDTWTGDAPQGAGVAGVEYTFYYEVRDDDADHPIHVDSPYHTAVYYVDGSVALRAHREGSRNRDDVPDPREDGEAVACFE